LVAKEPPHGDPPTSAAKCFSLSHRMGEGWGEAGNVKIKSQPNVYDRVRFMGARSALRSADTFVREN
jgi:hypothetical protein